MNKIKWSKQSDPATWGDNDYHIFPKDWVKTHPRWRLRLMRCIWWKYKVLHLDGGWVLMTKSRGKK